MPEIYRLCELKRNKGSMFFHSQTVCSLQTCPLCPGSFAGSSPSHWMLNSPVSRLQMASSAFFPSNLVHTHDFLYHLFADGSKITIFSPCFLPEQHSHPANHLTFSFERLIDMLNLTPKLMSLILICFPIKVKSLTPLLSNYIPKIQSHSHCFCP